MGSVIQHAKKNGFALISTLMVMILLMLVSVGILSLSITFTRNSLSVDNQLEARANARMALMLALGELQEQLGPYQRISAHGDILSLDSLGTAVTVDYPHWTGVWESWKAGAGEKSQHSTIGTSDEMAPTQPADSHTDYSELYPLMELADHFV